MSNTELDNSEDKRLTLEELRKLPSFETVSDEEGEAILNDLLAFTRMILEVID